MNRILTALSAAMLLTSASAVTAQTTQRLTATKANDYAIVYTLPQTQLSVTWRQRSQ